MILFRPCGQNLTCAFTKHHFGTLMAAWIFQKIKQIDLKQFPL
jgi:hypothetical protein